MGNVKVTKDQAIALVILAIAGAGVDQSRSVVDSFLSFKESEPAYIGNGCKLYIRRVGCVSSYSISGYAHDGSDVEKCILSLTSVALVKTSVSYRVREWGSRRPSIAYCNDIKRLSESCTPLQHENRMCA